MAKAKKKSSKKSSKKSRKKPNGWRQHHVGQQQATSSSGSGMSAHYGMSVRDAMYGPTREHMQKPKRKKAHKKAHRKAGPCRDVTIRASDITSGYRRAKSPLKRWTCAGVIRTGCGGSGSRVTIKVR